MKRTFEAVSDQIRENQEMIDHLESILTELDIARREEDLHFIRQELSDCGYTRKQAVGKGKKGRIPKSRPLHFISSDGYDIYVGKNNYQNDELTFKVATGNDWWFHAKQMPGSHVIVKCNGEEPPVRTFEEAGSLAAYFSKGKGADKLEIDYTQKKNIKKPNGSKPGFVVYYTNYSLMASSQIEGIRCVNDEDTVFLERSFLSQPIPWTAAPLSRHSLTQPSPGGCPGSVSQTIWIIAFRPTSLKAYFQKVRFPLSSIFRHMRRNCLSSDKDIQTLTYSQA